MKVPTYIAEKTLDKQPDTLLDRHEISILTQGDKAFGELGESIMQAGRYVAEGENVLLRQQEKIDAEIKARKRERDQFTIATNMAEQMQYWTKHVEDTYDPQVPEGFVARTMETFRERVKEKFDELDANDSDFAVQWGQRMAQLQTHVFAMANGKEAAGKIIKQENEAKLMIQTTSNFLYDSSPALETLALSIRNFEDAIGSQRWGGGDHGNKLLMGGKDQIATSYVRGLLSKDRTEEAKAILGKGLLDKYLSPDAKIALNQMIDQAEKHGNDAEKYRLTEQMASNVSSMANTGVAGPIDTGRISKKFGDGTVLKYQDDMKFAEESFKIKSKIENMPLGEGQAYVESLRPRGQEPGTNFADQQKLYQEAQKLLAQYQAQVVTDPMLVAQQKVQDIKGKNKNDPYFNEIISKSDEQGQGVAGNSLFTMASPKGQYSLTWQKLIDESIAYADANGFQRNGRVTPLAMVKHDVAAIQGLPADQLVQFFNQKRELWGDKYFGDYWKDLCRFGKLPTEYKVAMSVQDTEWKDKIITAIRMKDEDVKRAFKSETEYKDFHSSILNKLEPFKRVINMGAATSGRSMADITDMATVLTKAAALDYTTGVGSKSKKDAVNKLVKDFIYDRFHFVDKFVIPTKIENKTPNGTRLPPTPITKDDAAMIKTALSYLKSVRGMEANSFMPNGAQNAFNAGELKRSYEAYGYWVSNEDFSGVYLQYDYPMNNSTGSQAVEDRNRKRYEFKFKDLIRMQLPEDQVRRGFMTEDQRRRVLTVPGANKPTGPYAPPRR